MSRKEKRKLPPGRPKAPIDWTIIGNLCAAGASGASIAHEMGIVAETIYARCQTDKGEEFSAFRRRHYERGNDLLKVKQFQLAVNDGNERLLIFLGKNRLGQRDKVEMSSPAGEQVPVVTVNILPPSPDVGG